jgi:hypothetical protein
MHNISPAAFGAAATTAVTLRQSHTRSPRRTAVADDSFIDSISCRLIAPTHVSVEETPRERLSVVKVGFALALPPGMALEWVRLRFQIALADDDRAGRGRSRILSLNPARVAARTIVRGRIAVGATGELMREETAADEAEEGALTYQPNLLGWRMSGGEAIWYWLPVTRAPPLGADALFLSATYPVREALTCTRSVQFAVSALNRTDSMVLEHDAETSELVEPGPA